MSESVLGFYEFFAGGGMARLALGPGWQCLFANEFSDKKARAYRLNFGPSPELKVEDVRKLTTADLPSGATLSWGSFPCQDLSLAGNGVGLRGERSGTFVPFWNLMDALVQEGRGVPLIVLENVAGALTSNSGRDFRAIIESLVRSRYRVGAVVVDAVRFLPHSRARLFIVAAADDIEISPSLVAEGPSELWHPSRLRAAHATLADEIEQAWVWWKLPAPPRVTKTITEIIEDDPEDVDWHSPEQTERLLSLMSATNLRKVQKAQSYGKQIVGTVYKRIRLNESGVKVQRAEVRFDQISGCLRTPTGGSSRQVLLVVRGNLIRSRLLSPREAARLMGLPDTYRLPSKYNEAYHLAGDGLVIPAVKWLETHLLRPLALALPSAQCKVA